MAINFPNAPSVDDEFSAAGKTWTWDGTSWISTNAGSQGPQGSQGLRGFQGSTGLTGDQGTKGDKGDQGTQGEKGDQGTIGETGVQGTQGEKGDQGTIGETGVQGTQGEIGVQGTQGETGAQGTQGEKGDQGTQGSQGDTGISMVESPSTNQTASGVKGTFTAGTGGVVFGDVCYINSSGQMVKADASSAATAPAIAMALGTASASNTTEFIFVGIVRDDAWNWTLPAFLYLSETAGDITTTIPTGTDTVTQALGVATNADRVFFNPSPDYATHI